MDLTFELPWPPSVNTYWRRNGHVYFISKAGKDYRSTTTAIIKALQLGAPVTDRLSMTVIASAPDRRRRDLDNILKSLFDSLTHAGVYEDDSQIDQLQVWREAPGHGRVIVTVKTLVNP